MNFDVNLNLSGERFSVVYSLQGTREDAYAQAQDICVEQTIEFPADLVLQGDIRNHILGRIESFTSIGSNRWEATISFAVEIVGDELTQLLNVLFGNFSLKPGVRLERFDLPDRMLTNFNGPRFGIRGLRERIGVFSRPLFCTALKPMGLPVKDLAELAYQFALGGVDMIKDDHGLADQPFHPFNERVEHCAQAVQEANAKTGGNCLYIPNLSAPVDRIREKILFAKDKGVGGVMLAPGLVGLDMMRHIAEDNSLGLPVVGHPAFFGSFVTSPENGVSHHAIFGQLPRLCGADAVVYPNYGGRFSFSRDDCRRIVEGLTAPMGNLEPVFSMPGGGMSIERIPDMLDVYGKDVIFLIGGALHKMGPDLVDNCKRYLEALYKP
ncbi:MAG: RuBisCO large subunit C-terminal-like domain-containing protein [Candidatus Omnitrophota bacterium]